MTYRRIISLDPGGSTGWAMRDKDGGISHGTFGPEEHHVELWSFLDFNTPAVIVCERFVYQRRELDKGVSLRLDSMEYIGLVKLFLGLRMSTQGELVLQTPSQAKHMWSDENLKRLGLWGKTPHSRDALRHLLYYLCVNADESETRMDLLTRGKK